MAASEVAANAEGSTGVSHAQRGRSQVVTVQRYSELFYAPDIKNFVKAVEDQYNTDGERLARETAVLLSFKTAP